MSLVVLDRDQRLLLLVMLQSGRVGLFKLVRHLSLFPKKLELHLGFKFCDRLESGPKSVLEG